MFNKIRDPQDRLPLLEPGYVSEEERREAIAKEKEKEKQITNVADWVASGAVADNSNRLDKEKERLRREEAHAKVKQAKEVAEASGSHRSSG